MEHDLPEQRGSLFVLAAPPILWAIHFLLSYCTAAIWCAKYAGREGTLAPARAAIAVYTLAALAGLFWCGYRGYRHHTLTGGAVPHAGDTASDRQRFLGFATLLLAGLSAIATLYAALAAALIESCR